MSYRASENDRLDDLLADLATTGLDARDAAELATLTADPPRLAEPFELAAAALDRAFSVGAPDVMPQHVRASAESALRSAMAGAVSSDSLRLSRGAADAPLPAAHPTPYASTASRSSFAWAPWLIAAACLAFAASIWMQRQPQSPNTPNPAPVAALPTPEQLLSLPGTVRVQWQPQKDAACTDCSGDVIWDNASQQGYIRLHHLAVNDPTREQYQLWIIDKTQKHPIDGGVFDITAEGDVVIPIDAKIRVTDPAAFAVTVERPGGVVVSDLGRVAVMAPLTKG